MDGTRKDRRGWRADLSDYAIVHWEADPDAVRVHLPPGFDLATFGVGGRRRAIVSAVAFRDTLRIAGPLRVALGQVTYRTYARRAGQEVAWFFGTSASGPTVLVPRLLWRMPWHRARTRFDCAWDGDRLLRYRLDGRSRWAPFHLDAAGPGRPAPGIGQPAELDRNERILTHPTVGWFRRGDGQLATYSVAHDPLRLEEATASACWSGLFERLGLVAPGQAPLQVLVQRSAAFEVFLPPRLAAVAAT